MLLRNGVRKILRDNEKGEIFKVAMQMARTNQDIVGDVSAMIMVTWLLMTVQMMKPWKIRVGQRWVVC